MCRHTLFRKTVTCGAVLHKVCTVGVSCRRTKESVARIELQTIGFDGLLGVIFAE